jgi:hypothetical protein
MPNQINTNVLTCNALRPGPPIPCVCYALY